MAKRGRERPVSRGPGTILGGAPQNHQKHAKGSVESFRIPNLDFFKFKGAVLKSIMFEAEIGKFETKIVCFEAKIGRFELKTNSLKPK